MENGRATTEVMTPPVAMVERASALPVASQQSSAPTFTPYTPMTTDPLDQLREAEGYVVAEVIGDCEVSDA